MEARRFRAPHRKTQRRWRVPPALRRGEETFEGLAVLEEVRDARGVVLWQTLRDALLWADTDPADRGSLFAAHAERARMGWVAAAALPVEVEGPLLALCRSLSAPADAGEPAVAETCGGVSAWAQAAGLGATALAFAQAAAMVDPADASAAHRVAALALGRGEHARAETWFRRAVALGRQAGDWDTYARAFLGMGRLYATRGNLPAARRLLGRAVRAARRNALHEVEALALHELFAAAVDAGRTDEARELARGAFDAYGAGHPALPRLACDLARWWMAQGHFARAGNVLRSALPHLRAPEERLAAEGALGRAAAGVGDRDGFGEAWDRAGALLEAGDARAAAAGALLDLAHGAVGLGLWDRADHAARDAVEVATREGEARVRLAAEALADAVRHHRGAAARARPAPPPHSAAADARLATELIRTLRGAAAE